MDSAAYLTRNEAAVISTVSDVSASEKKDRVNSEPSPASKSIAVVQCEHFRCLAYREGDVWYDFQTGKELPEVKNVEFTFSV
jgi:hypothetical protein